MKVKINGVEFPIDKIELVVKASADMEGLYLVDHAKISSEVSRMVPDLKEWTTITIEKEGELD